MVNFVLKYGGFVGILLALYAIFELRRKPSAVNPSTNNLDVYIIGGLGAILNYYVFPYVLLFAIQCVTTIVVGTIGAFAMFVPLLIGIAIFWIIYKLFKKG